MMPKISNGSTFGGIVNYANDIKDKDTTILASRGVDLRSNYTIAKSFKIQAMMNQRVAKTEHSHPVERFKPFTYEPKIGLKSA